MGLVSSQKGWCRGVSSLIFRGWSRCQPRNPQLNTWGSKTGERRSFGERYKLVPTQNSFCLDQSQLRLLRARFDTNKGNKKVGMYELKKTFLHDKKGKGGEINHRGEREGNGSW